VITLACAVVVVGALCLVDLLLTFGVVRRLREHAALLAGIQSSAVPGSGLSDGDKPEPFTATDAEGIAVHGPAGLGVVAFFSTTCPVCPLRAPAFVEYVRAHHPARDPVLAVITGDAGASVPYLADLMKVARVCFEPAGGPVSQGFALKAVPAFFVLDEDGTVLTSHHDPAALPVPART
jgi:hypothetical protein